MSLQEIQAEVKNLGQSVVALKEATDEQLKAIKDELGTTEIDAKIEKISTAMGEYKAKLDNTEEGIKVQLEKIEADHKNRVDDLERKVNRFEAGALAGGAEKQEALRKNAKAFYTVKNDGRPFELTDSDIEAFQNYEKNFGAYLRKGTINNTLQVAEDGSGGYWVTPEISGEIVKKLQLLSPIRQIASVQTISSDSIEYGGDFDTISAGWVAEKADRSAVTSTPGIKKLKIDVHEMYIEPDVTQKVLDDAAVNVESWLSEKVTFGFALTETAAFVTGNGVGKPRGFLDYGTTAVTTDDATRANDKLQYIPTGASGGFDTISGLVADDANFFFTAIASLHPSLRPGAVWVMNRRTAARVRGLRDAQGRWLWEQSMQVGQPSSIFGYPVVEAEDLPDIASNSFSIAFGNFAEGYRIVDRLGIRTLRDPLTKKGFVIFYSTKRVGGDVLNKQALKLIKMASS